MLNLFTKKDEFTDISYWSSVKITRESLVKKVSVAASRYAKGRLLDLGCGTKPYEVFFTPYIESYTGVDYPLTADSNYGSLTKADIFADCTDTGLPAESFDTIVSMQVMEHIPDTRKYIEECYRLCKPGGFGVFTIPFVWQIHAEPYDYYRFTKYAIEQLFREGGFTVVELSPTEGAYATYMQLKIATLYSWPAPTNIFARLYRRWRQTVVVPLLNFLALKLDRFFWNDKLCLNYILIVQK